MQRVNRYVGGACYLLLILLCLFYYSETARLQKEVSAQQVVIDTDKKVIEALQEDQRRINLALVQRQCAIDRLNSELTAYEQAWKKEKEKNPQAKNWADQLLADSVLRLLEAASHSDAAAEAMDTAESSPSDSCPALGRKDK